MSIRHLVCCIFSVLKQEQKKRNSISNEMKQDFEAKHASDSYREMLNSNVAT